VRRFVAARLRPLALLLLATDVVFVAGFALMAER
jgi:hypothetical protein